MFDPENMKKPPSKVAHNRPPTFFFNTGPAAQTKEWPGKMIYLNFDSIFGDFFLKFFEEEVSDYLS